MFLFLLLTLSLAVSLKTERIMCLESVFHGTHYLETLFIIVEYSKIPEGFLPGWTSLRDWFCYCSLKLMPMLCRKSVHSMCTGVSMCTHAA